jgi:hypothetical protein
MPNKLTLKELAAKIANPNVPKSELAAYFRAVPSKTVPFATDIELNEFLVEDAVRRGQMAINIFNSYFAERRQRAYQQKISHGWPGVRLFAEGDSWFEYPDPFGDCDDVVDCLSNIYAIYCVSAAGATLENVVARAGEWESLLGQLKPDGFMFSAGGNDIAGPELRTYLQDFSPEHEETGHLTPKYAAFLARVEHVYDSVFGRLSTRFPAMHIFCHGYDWTLPQRGGRWLGPQFAAKNIPAALWAQVVRGMIDDFNVTLARTAAKYDDLVHYVDCRGAIGGVAEWRDELHARDPGCLRVAGRFRTAIDAVFPDLARAGQTFNPRAPVLPQALAQPAAAARSATGTPPGRAARSDIEPFAVTHSDPSYVVIEMFGGDNNLNAFVAQDTAEMVAGNPGNITTIAIADYANAPASIIEVGRNGIKVLEEWGEIDTGDPEVLSRFLTRALITYPNARKAIGFWDHGTGVFDETDTSENLTFRRMVSLPRGQRSRSRPQRRLFFPKGRLIDQPHIRSMLHDDTNGGLLTNMEASRMLEVSFRKAGFDGKIDLIFSDTCLNGMIEVLEQLKGYASCVVGSSDLEPGAGWNYTRWFSMMGVTPPAGPEDWARLAVSAFHDEYLPKPDLYPCTMGAFRGVNEITSRFKDLITAAKVEGPGGFFVLDQARAGSQGFANRDTYDIQDFASRTAQIASASAMKAAAEGLSAACDAACIHAIALGPMVAKSRGLAFWFPGSSYSFAATSQTYAPLAFNQATGWQDYLSQYR